MRRWLVVLVLLVAGCSGGGDGPGPAPEPSFAGSKFAACPAATGPVPVNSPLKSVEPLSCMVPKGEQVTIGAPTGRPMVLNLWASWCLPCKDEMPVMERFATAVGDRATVVGVNSGDDGTNAVAAATDVGVTFANVYDRDKKVLRALRVHSLPATAFVSPAGDVVFVHRDTVLTDATLAAQVKQYLGVTVG